jgi:DMSO/TMAO reductase YedYZ molybdopterin-dependent catalytic subunit
VIGSGEPHAPELGRFLRARAAQIYTALVSARVTDWGLAALVAALVASGALTLFAGSPGDAWVFAVHDALTTAIAVLLVVKLRRVWSRVTQPSRWDRRTILGVAGAVVVVATLGSGLLWSDGATPSLAGYSLLSVHDALGALLVLVVLVHMAVRAKRLRTRDLAGRRQLLAAGGVAAASFVVWRVQRPVQALLDLRGARRRFTGSYEAASFAGNAFPATSWVADHPRPVDLTTYRLRVHGLVRTELALALGDLPDADELVATLDCTGGFYSTQRWRGIRLDRLLDLAGTQQSARHVSVASVTGYRWSFGIGDARYVLLATHVSGERLSHDHGAPLRLVVPGARGFQWVKWVQEINLLQSPDYGAPLSTVWSSLTAAGRGQT